MRNTIILLYRYFYNNYYYYYYCHYDIIVTLLLCRRGAGSGHTMGRNSSWQTVPEILYRWYAYIKRKTDANYLKH